MSRVLASPRTIVTQSLLLDDIDWKTYSRVLRAFAEKPGIRMAYDRGKLEIMAPLLFEHEDDSSFLGRAVEVLTEELRLPIKSGGSTTLRRQLRRRGIEADECFWIANAFRMKGKRRLNLRTDPPPDLAIEVDVTHSSLDRLSIYAALKVPELWRLQGNDLTFYVFTTEGTYIVAEHSLAFPLITPATLLEFLDKARQAADENAVVQEFRQWIRQAKSK
jgi:Uma2 family endonuclease